MDRKEFLTKLSFGAAFALSMGCMGSCSKDQTTLAPLGTVDFTLDLNDPANKALKMNGGYVIKNSVVIARDNAGEIVAATQRCSHRGYYNIIFKYDQWYCPVHGARYKIDGSGLNGEASKGLTIYKTQINNNILHVYS